MSDQIDAAVPPSPPAPSSPFTGPTGLYGQPVAGGPERQADLFGSTPGQEEPVRRPPPRKGSPEWMERIYAPATAATPALF